MIDIDKVIVVENYLGLIKRIVECPFTGKKIFYIMFENKMSLSFNEDWLVENAQPSTMDDVEFRLKYL